MGLGTFFSMKNPAVLSSFMSRVIPGASSAIKEAGDEIVELALNEIHARLYPGHGFLTGALYASYKGSSTPVGTEVVDIKVGSDLFYAPINEFAWGGKNAHFFPAMQVVEQKSPEIIAKHINGIFGR